MEMNQKECGIVCKENGTEQIEKVTEEETEKRVAYEVSVSKLEYLEQ